MYETNKNEMRRKILYSVIVILHSLINCNNTNGQNLEHNEYHIQIYGQDSLNEFHNVGNDATVILLEKNFNKNFHDTLIIKDDKFTIKSGSDDCVKLLIEVDNHVIEEHFLSFKRWGGNRKVIYLRKPGQFYRYFKNFRSPFDPILGKAFLFFNNQNYSFLEFSDKSIDLGVQLISTKCPVYEALKPSSFINTFQNLESTKFVDQALPLLQFDEDCKNSRAFSKVILCQFTKDVNIENAKKILLDLDFVGFAPTDVEKNIYRFKVNVFNGYDFLNTINKLWERDDVIFIENIILDYHPEPEKH